MRELIAEEEAKEAERDRLDKAATTRVTTSHNNTSNNNIDNAPPFQPPPSSFDAPGFGGAEGAGPSGAAARNVNDDDDDSEAEGLPAETNLWDKAELDRVIQEVAVRVRGRGVHPSQIGQKAESGESGGWGLGGGAHFRLTSSALPFFFFFISIYISTLYPQQEPIDDGDVVDTGPRAGGLGGFRQVQTAAEAGALILVRGGRRDKETKRDVCFVFVVYPGALFTYFGL